MTTGSPKPSSHGVHRHLWPGVVLMFALLAASPLATRVPAGNGPGGSEYPLCS